MSALETLEKSFLYWADLAARDTASGDRYNQLAESLDRAAKLAIVVTALRVHPSSGITQGRKG